MKKYPEVTLPDWIIDNVKKRHPHAIAYTKIGGDGTVKDIIYDPEHNLRFTFPNKERTQEEQQKLEWKSTLAYDGLDIIVII